MQSAVEGLDETYRSIEPQLVALDRLLAEQMRDRATCVDAMLRYASRYSGKRLRPALVFIIAEMSGDLTDHHVKLGAVVEMIHMATLVHDDVVDRAAVRRNAASVNERWHNKDAVLLGDIIFARAINLLVAIGDHRALDLLTRTVSVICEGEIMQNQMSHDPSLDDDVYMDIIQRKTASLYSAGCELAAHLAGASQKLVGAFADYGNKLGTAFQIIDDCLDIEGDESVVGKSLGTDVLNGKMTLPMIHVLAHLEGADRVEMEGIIEGRDRRPEDIIRLRGFMAETGSIAYALKRAERLVAESLDALRPLLSRENLTVTEQIAGFVLNRRR
jgi:octaprenyl-diphosphate synthase